MCGTADSVEADAHISSSPSQDLRQAKQQHVTAGTRAPQAFRRLCTWPHSLESCPLSGAAPAELTLIERTCYTNERIEGFYPLSVYRDGDSYILKSFSYMCFVRPTTQPFSFTVKKKKVWPAAPQCEPLSLSLGREVCEAHRSTMKVRAHREATGGAGAWEAAGHGGDNLPAGRGRTRGRHVSRK